MAEARFVRGGLFIRKEAKAFELPDRQSSVLLSQTQNITRPAASCPPLRVPFRLRRSHPRERHWSIQSAIHTL